MSIVADQARFQLFSPLSAEKYAALKEDIRKNGVLVPVELDQNGEVLDGHHRIRIWEELRNEGLPVADYPRVVREFSSDDDREEHAAKINSNRRDISTEDKQRIALRWRQRGWSYRRIADALGVNASTVLRWMPDEESTVADATVGMPDRVIGMDGKSRPATMPKPVTPESGVEERYIDAGTGEILDDKPTVTPGARDRVTYMLSDPERSRWSDAKIAERCDVPEVFVSVVRRDIEAREQQQEIPAWQPPASTPAPTPKNVHVSNNSGENEWYTPPQYIAAAREVLGEIDLDPASSIKANETVQAQAFFTKNDNGLTKEWHGRVWMNPPYAQPLISEFSDKVVEEYDAARIDAAIVLVNNATETRWFQKMARSATAICFPAGRIKYLDATGTPANTPLQGQAFLYFGPDHGRFISVFEQFGVVR